MSEKTEADLLAEELAAIDAEEKAAASAAKERADRTRVAKYRLEKETEKTKGRNGVDFTVLEGLDGFLFIMRKPDPMIWQAFSRGEKSQPDWEKLYQWCLVSSVGAGGAMLDGRQTWEAVAKQMADAPLLIEDAMVAAIYSMLRGGREARTAKSR